MANGIGKLYKYNGFDSEFVSERNKQFRQQVARRVNGLLTEEEFTPLRLLNGLYLQTHSYMLRVAVPYGVLNSRQMNQLALIADRWDKGYGHFTTRQNIQFNWPDLISVPDILDCLAEVGMHAIQTSGNTIRNITSDPFAGASADEIENPLPYAELLRQWSTDHPEFQFLPRKFKIAITGSLNDRAATRFHDIGLRIITQNGQTGFEVSVGGGLGRTPIIGQVIRAFLPEKDFLPYIESVISVWNLLGRRDNKYKARIKIIVRELGLEEFGNLVEKRFDEVRNAFSGIDGKVLQDIKLQFAPAQLTQMALGDYPDHYKESQEFRTWVDNNVSRHKVTGYGVVTVSLKSHGTTPGDATSKQMKTVASIAKQFSHDELRISNEQNIVFPHVHKSALFELYRKLKHVGLASSNVGLISDIVACPGLDYCKLATARSIPLAKELGIRFHKLDLEQKIGSMKIKISGCINACGHHHLGHIGILGLERAGKESYQVVLGGEATGTSNIGENLGPGFSSAEIAPVVEELINEYLVLRSNEEETFLDTYKRVGILPFREKIYQVFPRRH